MVQLAVRALDARRGRAGTPRSDIQVPITSGCSMLSTTRSAGLKSKHSMKNRSTRPGSSAAIRAWSIQCVPTPRMFRGQASGLIDPVSVPVNSMSV